MGDLKFYLLLLSIWVLSTLLLRRLLHRRRPNLPPGPPGLPIIGHLHMVGPIPHQAFHRISSSYGPIIHLRLGSSSLVVVNTAEGARDVYKTSELAFADRPQSYASRKFAYDSAGFAFAPYGPYWKFVKKLCMSELLGGRTLDALSPIRWHERLRA
ncbi:Cytochrome P450 93A1 [Acorus calamus]|uniref:Cytochrome P450 93A1 n=1 Tax=Acorus calamus TaxID=4465 RepID=A0AAV9BYI2_ACOCL|nr:Cytochrome P450 93A1 [Acorus calamus]